MHGHFGPNQTLKNTEFLNQKMEMLRKNKVSNCKMRMSDIHKDNWSLGFLFLLQIIHNDFNIVLTLKIGSKQVNVENVNWFKNYRVCFLLDICSNWLK